MCGWISRLNSFVVPFGHDPSIRVNQYGTDWNTTL